MSTRLSVKLRVLSLKPSRTNPQVRTRLTETVSPLIHYYTFIPVTYGIDTLLHQESLSSSDTRPLYRVYTDNIDKFLCTLETYGKRKRELWV